MIPAERLQTLTTFTHHALQMALGKECKDTFTGAKFLGLTNAGQFCYMVTYKVQGGTDSTKVFLTYNHSQGIVKASY